MKAKIYFNPKCGTCHKTLALMKEAGYEPEIIEYLKTPPNAEELSGLLERLGLEPQDVLRKKGQVYDGLKSEIETADRAELIALMVKNPVLINRPIVVTERGARLSRPPETVKEIL